MGDAKKPGWGAFLPRFNIPETFGAALSYEAQLHWFLDNWDAVAEFANALEQPTVTVGKTEFPDTSNALLPSITNSGTDINAVLDFVYPVIRTRFADPLQWDFDTAYDVLTVVSDGSGNSYTSRQAVPANTPLTNTDYWVRTGNYDAALESAQTDIDNIKIGYVKMYQSVADMCADSELYPGMFAATARYHSDCMGGGALYVIGSSGTANGIDVLACANQSTFANLVLASGGMINIACLGAKDGQRIDDIMARAISLVLLNNPVQNVAGDRKKGGGVVVIPSGNYLLDSAISMAECVSIEGCTKDSTVITCSAGFASGVGNDSHWDVMIRNLTLVGPGKDTTSKAIEANRLYNGVIDNCKMVRFGVAVSLAINVNTTISNCDMYENGTGINIRHISGTSSTTTYIRKCWIAHNDTGFSTQPNCVVYPIVIDDTIFEYNTRGFYVRGSASSDPRSYMFMTHCYLEGNTNTSVISDVISVLRDNFKVTEGDIECAGSDPVIFSESVDKFISYQRKNTKVIEKYNGVLVDTINKTSTFATSTAGGVYLDSYADKFYGFIYIVCDQGTYFGHVGWDGSSGSGDKIGGSINDTFAPNSGGYIPFGNYTNISYRLVY